MPLKHGCFCTVRVLKILATYPFKGPISGRWCELTCCDSHQLSLLLLGPSTAVTSAIFCHQFAQASTAKCKSLLICTALAFWLPLLGLICAPRVIFSHSYSEEMTVRLMKFVREQLCSATSHVTEGWRENHRASRKWSWGLARKCHALHLSAECLSSSSLSSFHKWYMSGLCNLKFEVLNLTYCSGIKN